MYTLSNRIFPGFNNFSQGMEECIITGRLGWMYQINYKQCEDKSRQFAKLHSLQVTSNNFVFVLCLLQTHLLLELRMSQSTNPNVWSTARSQLWRWSFPLLNRRGSWHCAEGKTASSSTWPAKSRAWESALARKCATPCTSMKQKTQET